MRTLGEFAALPAPSVARPLEADYQALARGESGAHAAPVHAGGADPRGDRRQRGHRARACPARSAVRRRSRSSSRRIALRLAGRGRGAARIDVAMIPTKGEVREVPVTIDGAIVDAEELARVLAPVLETAAADLPETRKPRWLAPARRRHGRSRARWRDSSKSSRRARRRSQSRRTRTHRRLLDSRRRCGLARSLAASRSPPALLHSSGRCAVLKAGAALVEPMIERLGSANDSQSQAQLLDDDAINPLSVVLASSGSLFALASPTGMGGGRPIVAMCTGARVRGAAAHSADGAGATAAVRSRVSEKMGRLPAWNRYGQGELQPG